MQHSTHPLSWSKRIGFGSAILLGGLALVTTALAAAVTEHGVLHAQFCDEVDGVAAAEPLLGAALAFMALDPQ